MFQGGQHRVVGGGGHQVQLAGQLEHHRTVLDEVTVHQDLVVVAVEGRHLLDVGQLRGEPARLLHGRDGTRRPLTRRLPVRNLAFGVQVFQHRAVGADQPLGGRALPLADLLQLRFGLLEVGRHPLAQHLGQVVAGPHPRGMHQARHQRHPLDRRVVPHRRRVLSGRLPSEISDLARGDPRQPRGGIAQRVDLVQVLGLGLEPQPGGALRRFLQPVEHRPAIRARRGQQRLHPLPPVLAHTLGDRCEDLDVDLGADTRRPSHPAWRTPAAPATPPAASPAPR